MPFSAVKKRYTLGGGALTWGKKSESSPGDTPRRRTGKSWALSNLKRLIILKTGPQKKVLEFLVDTRKKKNLCGKCSKGMYCV